MEFPPYLTAGAVSAVLCLPIDWLAFRIRRQIFAPDDFAARGAMNTPAGVLFALLVNFIMSTALALIYFQIGGVPGHALIIGAAVWLMITVPLVVGFRYLEAVHQKLFTIRMVVWLMKTGVAAAVIILLITVHGG